MLQIELTPEELSFIISALEEIRESYKVDEDDEGNPLPGEAPVTYSVFNDTMTEEEMSTLINKLGDLETNHEEEQ